MYEESHNMTEINVLISRFQSSATWAVESQDCCEKFTAQYRGIELTEII